LESSVISGDTPRCAGSDQNFNNYYYVTDRSSLVRSCGSCGSLSSTCLSASSEKIFEVLGVKVLVMASAASTGSETRGGKLIDMVSSIGWVVWIICVVLPYLDIYP